MDQVKRKQTDEPDNETDQKKLKLEEETDQCYITQLPECVLTVLLSYFDVSSLYSLSQTCHLFKDLLEQSIFWRYVDARSPPDDQHKFAYCCKHISERTTHFLYFAKSQVIERLRMPIYNRFPMWSNLKVLALENQYISGDKYALKRFPPCLEELSFRKTYIAKGFDFLRFSSSLERLRVLILDHCQWFDASMLISIANFKTLEILSVYMCKKLSDRDISYLSLSGDYGLKNIKIIDARYTAVGHQLLSSLYKSTSIQELYFQCYSSTYQLDKAKRKLAIHRGAKPELHAYMSDEDQNLDTSKRRMKKRFGDVPFRTSKTDTITDASLSMFKYVEPYENPQRERPKSFLYKYPYGECKCGYYKSFWGNTVFGFIIPKSDYSFHDRDDDETRRLKHQIRRRRNQLKMFMRDCNVPSLYHVLYNIQSNKKNNRMEHFQWMNERPPQTEEEVEMLEHTIVEKLPDASVVICAHNGMQYSFTGDVEDVLGNENSDSEQSSDTDGNEDEEEDVPSDDDYIFRRVKQPHPRLHITRMPLEKPRCKLNILCLRGYPNVTDVALQYLRDVRLDLLDVSYTNVTPRGVRDYMTMHPNCRVIHNTACTCAPRMHF